MKTKGRSVGVIGVLGILGWLIVGGWQTALAMDATQAYRLRQAFQRQERNMATAEQTLKELTAYVEKAKYIPKWDDRLIPVKLQAIEEDLKANNAPADDPRYVKLKARVDAARAKLQELQATAQPKIQAYDKYTNMKNYPDFEKDLRNTQAIAKMYNKSTSVFQTPPRALDLVKDLDRMIEYINGNAKKYAPLMNFKTPEGNRFGAQQKRAVTKLVEFRKARDQYGESAPAKIQLLLNQAGQAADRAKAAKNADMISRTAQRSLDEAKERLDLLQCIKGKSDAEVAKLSKALASKQKEIDGAVQALTEQMIASTRAPRDEYTGRDKAALVSKVKAAWKKKYPKDKILTIRCHLKDWERNNGLEWNTTQKRWEGFDRQYLVVSVIVQTDNRIATIYPAFINRDNIKKTENIGVDTKKGSYIVKPMLIANLKR